MWLCGCVDMRMCIGVDVGMRGYVDERMNE